MEGASTTVTEEPVLGVETSDVGTSPVTEVAVTLQEQEGAIGEQVIMVCDGTSTQTVSADSQTMEMLNVGQQITFIPVSQGPATTVVIGPSGEGAEDPSGLMQVEGMEVQLGGEGEGEDKAVNTVAVQANDYEIERRSGRNPARQRIIPFKFRDLFDTELSDEERKDEDYNPEVEKKQTTGPRRPGRPRKYQPGTRKVQDIISTPKGFKCGHCSKIFSQKGNLKVHLLIHYGKRPFPCDEDGCGKAFRSKESLRRHKMAHEGIKPFECDVCHNKFCSQTALQEHQARHSDSKPHSCEVCGRAFRQVSCLRRHLITHTNNKPHPCTLCGRHFSQLIYLRSHMKTHTGERPFQCDQCFKSFAHQTDLTRHRIIHTGEKPFKCTVCQRKFSDPSSCRRHIKDHAKSYACPHCSEHFKREGQLRRHLSKSHLGSKLEVTGENGTSYSIELCNPTSRGGATESVDWSTEENQKRIVSLIKHIPGLVVRHVQITRPDGLTTTQEVASLSTEDAGMHMETLPGVETAATVVAEETDSQVTVDVGEDGEGGLAGGEKTVIAMVEGVGGEGEVEGALPISAFQIIQGLAQEAGSSQQVFEVHVRSASPSPHSSPKQEVSIEETSQTDWSEAESSAVSVAQVVAEPPGGSKVDYVASPDFTSQDYYNWLSDFTEQCKLTALPLDVALFQRISQVHKSLSDFMATPSGVIADRENFRELMNISRDLNAIITEHLSYVLSNLHPEPTS